MALFDDVKGLLVDNLAVKPEMVKPDAKVTDDLGADSLDAVELVAALEERFGISISDEEAKQITTVSCIIDLVEQKIKAKTSS